MSEGGVESERMIQRDENAARQQRSKDRKMWG